MFVSNSGISSLIGDNIKNALNQLYETGNPKIIFELLSDIKFLSNNDMPDKTETLTKIFFIKYLKNIKAEIFIRGRRKKVICRIRILAQF